MKNVTAPDPHAAFGKPVRPAASHPQATDPGPGDAGVQRRSERAMHQAAKMEAIEVLAGGIAHDFNNRLTVILGNLELLEAEVGDAAEALSLIRDARQAAENGSGLARQLLAIARPQVAHHDLNDINGVIGRLENVLGHCLGKSAKLHLWLKADLPQVAFDTSALEDALVNLTLNARDAMDAGDSLTIETDRVWLDGEQLLDKPDLAAGEYAMIAIADSGKGMSASVRERAFEPYFTTKGEAGSGLGLSMVYSFAHRLNGHVSIYSEVDHGTCVRIYIPALKSEAPQPPSATVLGSFAGRKVMVVEDKAQIRDIVSRVLQDMGCDVHAFASAEGALEHIGAGSVVDLLLTDIVIDGPLDGISLAALAKRARPAMKVIFTSGYTTFGPFADRLPKGNDCCYISKPSSPKSIAAAMAQLFSANSDDDEELASRAS